MRVRRRRVLQLLAVFSAVTAAGLLVIAAVALRAIVGTHRDAVAAARTELAALGDASELQDLLYQKGFAASYLLTGDERWLRELDRASPGFTTWMASVTHSAGSPASAADAANLASEYGRYDADRARSIALYRDGRRQEAIDVLVGNSARAARLRELASRLLRTRRDEIEARMREADRDFDHALLVLAIAALLATAGAAAAGYLMARRIARPLYELVLRAESAGGGARVEVSAEDEIVALSEHVTRLARHIEASSVTLASQRARLTQAEKMSALGEMASAVAHELLNPLTGVKTAVQLLARTFPTDGVVETAAAVDAEIRRVEAMARRLLAFTRPVRPDVARCSLSVVATRVEQATRAEAEARGAALRVEVGAGASVEADPDLLVQALVNLVTNACQAVAPGGVVTLSARTESGATVIEVRDDGPGIAREVVDRLFTPFVTTRRDGHGLGLAVTQNIALAHGGRVEARANAPAPGSTFALWLPSVRATPPEGPALAGDAASGAVA